MPSTAVYRGVMGVRGCGSDGVIPSMVSVSGPPDTRPAGATEETVGHDVRAMVTRRTGDDGRREVTVTVPGRARVLVASPDGDLVERILASLRTVDVDGSGCRTVQPEDPAWDRPDARGRVRAGSPTSISVCSYVDGVLTASATLTGDRARALAAALDDARPGPLPVPDSCLPDDEDSNPVWLRLNQADGSVTPVRLRYANCTVRWVASPDGVSQVTRAQLAAVFGPLDVGYGFPGPLP